MILCIQFNEISGYLNLIRVGNTGLSDYRIMPPKISFSSDDIMSQVARWLAGGLFGQVTFFCGSIMSRGSPTSTPDVGELRQHIMQSFYNATNLFPEVKTVLQILSPDGQFLKPEDKQFTRPFQENFYKLPFEQFMGCLATAHDDIAQKVILKAFGPESHGKPNSNHKALAGIALAALERQLCHRVNILTTNYDSCFEEAFGNLGYSLRPCERERLAVGAPMFKSDKCNLFIGKLHGDVASLNSQDSPVFTFRQIVRIMARPDHFAKVGTLLTQSNLVVFLGYGLNDIDIRPTIRGGLSGSRSIVIWNDWPPQNAASREGNATEAIRGMRSARDELLHRCRIWSYHGNLLPSIAEEGAQHPLKPFCEALDLDLPCTAPREPISNNVEQVIHSFLRSSAEGNETLEIATTFIAHLADACNVSDASDLLAPYALQGKSSQRRAEHVSLYLNTFGHCTDYKGAISEVEVLTRKNQPISIKIPALSYVGFIYTLQNKAIPAIKAFVIGYLLRALAFLTFRSVRKEDCVMFTHFWLHLLLRMVIMSSYKIMNRRLIFRFTCWLGTWAIRLYLVLHYWRLQRRARHILDLRGIAGILDVTAQAFLMIGFRKKANKYAEEMQGIYEQVQYLNGIGLSDRTRAWIALSERPKPNLIDARRRFSRAVMLGLSSIDTSLLPKFISNLVRVLCYEADICLLEFDTTLRTLSYTDRLSCEGLKNTCRYLWSTHHRLRKESCEEKVAILVMHLKALCQTDEWNELRDLLIKLRDVGRFPIFIFHPRIT